MLQILLRHKHRTDTYVHFHFYLFCLRDFWIVIGVIEITRFVLFLTKCLTKTGQKCLQSFQKLFWQSVDLGYLMVGEGDLKGKKDARGSCSRNFYEQHGFRK